MLKVYVYNKCSTCQKALTWLAAKKVPFKEIPIRERPPAMSELKTMLTLYDGQVRRLFNTSGMDYRAQNLSDKLPGMTTSAALGLLVKNGNLVKRPFLLAPDGRGAVGFREEEWKALL